MCVNVARWAAWLKTAKDARYQDGGPSRDDYPHGENTSCLDWPVDDRLQEQPEQDWGEKEEEGQLHNRQPQKSRCRQAGGEALVRWRSSRSPDHTRGECPNAARQAS